MSPAYEIQEHDKLHNFTGQTPQGYTEFIGAEWIKECDPPGSKSRADWARDIRAALKKEWETDFGTFDPSKVKLSVVTGNYSGGGSITVTIKDIADIGRFNYRDDCQIRKQIKQIASQWQRSSSHHVSDYYQSNFILFVNYGGFIEEDIFNLPSRPVVTQDQYRDRAREEYGRLDHYEVAVDYDADVIVVEDCNGAWVEARVWVPLSDFNEPEETWVPLSDFNEPEETE